MTTVNGISDFLNQADTHFKVFDMGRRIQEMSAEDFLAFEQGKTPYLWPLQQQAWLAIMVWNDSSASELVIWFLRFPLDAKGCLTPTIRDDFVYRLLQKAEGNRPQGEATDDETNPYGFKPKQEHMASFHARAAKILGQPASRFYQHAQDYFSGKPGFDQWAFVGFQGIADIATRLDEDNNLQDLARAIPLLPEQPLDALCQCLEHEQIDDSLLNALGQRIDTELAGEAPDCNRLSLYIRAISAAENQIVSSGQIQKILDSSAGTNAEVLAAISGRCWTQLTQPALMTAFLEKLAACPEGQAFFNLVIIDLINIPGMQAPLHEAIRNPERSATLARAIGDMFQNFTQ
ncbi:MAG: DUF3549 family protein [Gammaproteobacteria bacterium]|nr:DUF3549 family protein [Gammaproteobacteria bacterium]